LRPIRIHAANPGPFTGTGNWTYLIPGDTPVLIDAGVGQAAHLDEIAAAVPTGPSHVLVTHAHRDHASGSPAIRARWPEARFWKRPWPEKDQALDVSWHPLEDCQKIAAGDGELEVVHTPGHAPDHVVFWHAASRSAFVGDLVVLGSTVFIPASDGGSLLDYLQSLRRLLALNPARLYPAHGAVIDEPAALIQQYLDHRHQREAQILETLEAGHSTVDAITARVYVGLSSALVPMARESVLAHLRKLEHDGLVRADGSEWAVLP
jgi:glyoxylase-like metal-dependent hydrolase (beta-lactamase superfamily II)